MAMPKFHFEIVDGYRIEDPVGLELNDAKEAVKVAEAIAKQIAIEVSETSVRKVEVVTEDGERLHRAAVKSPADR
jgi:hypothetical protein